MEENRYLLTDSNDQKELLSAIIEFQKKCPKIDKTKIANMGKYSYKFAPLDIILEYIYPVLNECKLGFIQELIGSKSIMTTIFHESGQYRSSIFKWDSVSNIFTDVGKEITYYKRYALCSLLGIVPSGEDNGGEPEKKEYKAMSKENKAILLSTLDEKYVNDRPQYYKRLNDALMSIDKEIWRIDLKEYLSQFFILKPGILDYIEDGLLEYRKEHGYTSSEELF